MYGYKVNHDAIIFVMQEINEIKMIPSFGDYKNSLDAISFSGLDPIDVSIGNDTAVSVLYILFAIVGLVSVALIFHWFRYGNGTFFAILVTAVYGVGTLALFGYLLFLVSM